MGKAEPVVKDSRKWNVHEVTSKTSMVEWGLAERLPGILKPYGFEFKIAVDEKNQKCLRFALLTQAVNLKREAVKSIISSIRKTVTDANVTCQFGVTNVDDIMMPHQQEQQ